MLDELTYPDPPGVAVLADPQRNQFPDCPCGSCCRQVTGAMPGWHYRKGPAPVLDAYWRNRLGFDEEDDVREYEAHSHGLSVAMFLEHGDHGAMRSLLIPNWVDHKYRLRLTDGRWCYMCEPYELRPEVFGDFAALEAAGFDVKVTAYRARHLRGRSLAVEIVERKQRIPQALYRFFDAADRLLYVGITVNPGARWSGHSKEKPWWADVAKMTVEWLPDRESVESAERAAIKAEKPLHNIVHNRPHP